MRLKIDQFYEDAHMGRLKYKGELEGNLIFDQYKEVLGYMTRERVTFQPQFNRRRIAALKPTSPPS